MINKITRVRFGEIIRNLSKIINEQRYITAKADYLMILCDQLESRIKQANKIQQKTTEATIKSLAA